MPHHPKPFFRKSRRLWYVQIDGTQHNLGPDRERAFQMYHELMRRPQSGPVASGSVVATVEAFLDWCQKHRAPDTYEWYRYRLQRFVDSIGPDLKVGQLKPFHVQQWIDGYEKLANGSRRNYCRSIQRAMRWAEQQGYVDRSPIAHMEKPAGGKREVVISSTEFDNILGCVRDREFRDLLYTSWESGCRPQESLRVEARHIDLERGRWVFPKSEEKMNRTTRVVYLTDRALEITKRLVLAHPEGLLFRNTRGVPWTTDAVNCRFISIAKKLGKKYCLYVIRHTWMNRLLTSGVDGLTVAILAGHADPSMLAKTYQHLSQNPEYLRNAVRKATA